MLHGKCSQQEGNGMKGVLKISSVEMLFPLLPKGTPAIEVLSRDSGSLETLAERIEGSILLVVAR